MITFLSTQILDYEEFKENLDIALNNTADNMVRVGYLLQQARDTDILKESGYSGMGEFAQKEYGLTADQTSRFIGIAERFGDGEGRLMDQWQQFGFSKLSEMLTLPDHVNEVLTPDITREEIRDLKAEVKAEEQITPIEAAIEKAETDDEETPILQKFFKEYFRPIEHAWDFFNAITKDWSEIWGDEENKRVVLDALAPSGIAILEARIPGEGRYLLSFKGETMQPTLVGIRNDTKEEVLWRDVRDGFSVLADGHSGSEKDLPEEEAIKSCWEELYGEKFPGKKDEPEKSDKTSEKPEKKSEKKPEKKVKIAPAQTKKEKKSPETEKKSPDVETKSHEVENDAPFEADGAAVADPVKDAMNPPEVEEPLPRSTREYYIDETVKRINRCALDLRDYVEKLEKLTRDHNYLYVQDLFFDTNEMWNKMVNEGEKLTGYLKQRWDDDGYQEQHWKHDQKADEEEGEE
ncbi:MAG: hypothetical protein IJ899_04025 [Blautia sp.]|nr:hypothetical protein [Blautia sp.]